VNEGNRSFASLVEETIDVAIEHAGVRPSRMKKGQRVALVHELDLKGVFLVKNSKELLATKLGVSQAAIYKYIEEARKSHGRE